MKFRKKPVVIEARQATGTPESNREIIDWTRGSAEEKRWYDQRANAVRVLKEAEKKYWRGLFRGL